MTINPDILPPCGLYCGVCAVHIATLEGNQKLKELLVGVYKKQLPDSEYLTTDMIQCHGCRSNDPFVFCTKCDIKDCTGDKGIEGCYQCSDFPCKIIDEFPIPLGKKVIMRNIPRWKELGTEQWIAEEIARYVCSECGNKLFRGAGRCNKCGIRVDVD